MISVPTAIELFAQSFAYLRSFMHPVEVIEIGPLWTIRDAPGRKGGPRTEEIIVFPSSEPYEVVSQIRDYAPQGRFFLDVFQTEDESMEEINDAYKQQGYRRLRTEPLMALTLQHRPQAQTPHTVQRVETQAQADAVAKAARHQLIKPQHLIEEPPVVRVYYVEKDGKVVAWTHSIRQHEAGSYLAGMYTAEAYRRQGMASALLARMAADESRAGVKHSVLLASRAGSLLYTHFGYTQIGLLHMLAPK